MLCVKGHDNPDFPNPRDLRQAHTLCLNPVSGTSQLSLTHPIPLYPPEVWDLRTWGNFGVLKAQGEGCTMLWGEEGEGLDTSLLIWVKSHTHRSD